MSTRERVQVWGMVKDEARVCEFGQSHHVRLYAPKILGPVIGTRVHNNGYERRDTELRQDYQGRTYHQHIEIDYHSNMTWVRDGDRKRFEVRLPFNGLDIRND